MTALYYLLWLCQPLWWVIAPIKRYVERYADPTTHRAYVVNNWSRFPVNPGGRKI